MTWMLRGLLGVGGGILAFVAWPVANGAWQAQKADAVVFRIFAPANRCSSARCRRHLTALDRAVAADPVAGRRLGGPRCWLARRSRRACRRPAEQRAEWLKQAQADLDFGLANAPARGVALGAPCRRPTGDRRTSAKAVAALMMSIDIAPMMESLWPGRLQLILDNWQFFTPKERERIAAYVVMNWRASRDRRGCAEVIRSPIDELSSAISCGTSRTPRRS